MPDLIYACVLTDDIDRLDTFYRQVLQMEPTEAREAYREFPTQPGIFSLWSLTEFRSIVGNSAAQQVAHGGVMLEFQVPDADAEYARLQNQNIDFVLPPTTLSWGNRSIYFHDPDGNLINFFTPPK
ncbi:MAG TPA: VOC family protein [Chloroflexota bacterium]|jgi:catechol 2,3-dioxygenase-like lactoylglutathione lyase family enzyme